MDEATMTNKGTSLVEVLLYVAIVSVVLLSVVSFVFLSLQTRTRFQVIGEVDQQGTIMIEQILQKVRNAETIDSPSIGSSSSSLSLGMQTGLADPVSFQLSSGMLQLTESTGSAVDMHNSRVEVESITFSNVSNTSTPGSVRVELQLSYVSNSPLREYSYTKTFYGSGSVRP